MPRALVAWALGDEQKEKPVQSLSSRSQSRVHAWFAFSHSFRGKERLLSLCFPKLVREDNTGT